MARAASLTILLDVLGTSAHLLEREPAALGPHTHNLLYNDYGEEGPASWLLERVRAHLEHRAWLELRTRARGQIRRALLRVLSHGGDLRGAAWVAGGGEVVTADANGEVRIWDAATGSLLQADRGGPGEVHAVRAAPARAAVAVATADGVRVRASEVQGGWTSFLAGSEAFDLGWDPAGARLAWVEAGAVRLADPAQPAAKPRTVASDPILQPPLQVAWSPDGGRLAVGCRYGWRIWRADDWTVVRDECGLRRPAVTALAWSARGRLALGIAIPREGRQHHGRARGVIAVVGQDGGPVTQFEPRGGPVSALAWRPGGGALLAASFANERSLGVYGVGVGLNAVELVTSIRDAAAPLPLENLVTLWDVERGQPAGAFRGHRALVTSLAWSPDGSRLLSGAEDGTARMWRADLPEPLELEALARAHLDRICCAAICPSGTTYATASDDTTVRLWDLEADQPAMVVEKGDFAISALAWAPGSHYDVVVRGVGRRAGILARADEGFFRRSLRLRDLTHGDLARLPRSSFRTTAIAWSPDGGLVAGAGARVAVWRTSDRKRRWSRGARGGATALAWSPDGDRLLWAERGRLRVWHAERGRVDRSWALRRRAVSALAWLPEDRCVVGYDDGVLALLHPAGPGPAWTTPVAGAPVRCLAAFPEADLLVAALGDASLKLFRLTTGRLESAVFLPSAALAVRVREWELDVVDDGTASGARPGAYRFTLRRPAAPRRAQGRGRPG